MLRGYSREGNKRGGSLTVFPKFSRPSWTKMSEISINTVENIDEIDQIILLTTCTTKLHRYYRVTLHFLDFHQQVFPQISSPPFITFARVHIKFQVHSKCLTYLTWSICLKKIPLDLWSVHPRFRVPRNHLSLTWIMKNFNHLDAWDNFDKTVKKYFLYLEEWSQKSKKFVRGV